MNQLSPATEKKHRVGQWNCTAARQTGNVSITICQYKVQSINLGGGVAIGGIWSQQKSETMGKHLMTGSCLKHYSPVKAVKNNLGFPVSHSRCINLCRASIVRQSFIYRNGK